MCVCLTQIAKSISDQHKLFFSKNRIFTHSLIFYNSSSIGLYLFFFQIIVYGLLRPYTCYLHYLGYGRTCLVKPDGSLLLRLLHFCPLLSAEPAPPFLCSLDSGSAPFQYKAAVILGQRCEYLHGKPADSGRGVEIVLKGNKFDMAVLQLGAKVEHFLNGASKTVKPENDKRIAGAQIIHAGGQPLAVELLAGNLVRKDADTSRLIERILLRNEVLLLSANSGISYFFSHKSKLNLTFQS